MAVMQGKDRILLVRRLDKASLEDAKKPLYQIEHEWEYSRDNKSEQTKDGSVPTSGGLEVTLSLKGLASYDDENMYMKKSVEDGATMEFWDVDLKGVQQEGKYPAIYGRGKVGKWKLPANVEDLVEIETEATIEGTPKDGFATVSESTIQEAQYAFQDTTKTTTEG